MVHLAMTDQFTVRIATAADASTLAQQRAAMFRDMGVLPQPLDAPLVDASRRYFEEAIPAKEYLGWVASVAGSREVIAGAGLQLRRVLPHPDLDRGELILGLQGVVLNVYTEPAWRRRGLAAHLMRYVLDWAKVRGYRSGDNPARWRGRLDLAKLLPNRSKVQPVIRDPSYISRTMGKPTLRGTP